MLHAGAVVMLQVLASSYGEGRSGGTSVQECGSFVCSAACEDILTLYCPAHRSPTAHLQHQATAAGEMGRAATTCSALQPGALKARTRRRRRHMARQVSPNQSTIPA